MSNGLTKINIQFRSPHEVNARNRDVEIQQKPSSKSRRYFSTNHEAIGQSSKNPDEKGDPNKFFAASQNKPTRNKPSEITSSRKKTIQFDSRAPLISKAESELRRTQQKQYSATSSRRQICSSELNQTSQKPSSKHKIHTEYVIVRPEKSQKSIRLNFNNNISQYNESELYVSNFRITKVPPKSNTEITENFVQYRNQESSELRRLSHNQDIAGSRRPIHRGYGVQPPKKRLQTMHRENVMIEPWLTNSNNESDKSIDL